MIKLNRIIALMLLFTMILSLSMLSVFAADDSSGDAETPSPEQTEAVTPDPEPTNTATPSPEPTDTATPGPEPTDTDTPSPEPTDTATPSPEPTDTDTPSPEPTDTDTPSPEPTNTATPSPEPSGEKLKEYNNLSATVYASEAAYMKSVAGEPLNEGDVLSDVVITLSGSMPENATVVAYLVPSDDLPDSLDDVNVLCAYDITIYSSNGNDKFEPDENNSISVSISEPAIKNAVNEGAGAEDFSVFHVDEAENSVPEEILGVDVGTDDDTKSPEVGFEAKEFSIYVVGTNTNYKEDNPYTVNIGNSGEWASVYLSRGTDSTFENWSIEQKSTSGYSNTVTNAKLEELDQSPDTVRFSVSKNATEGTIYRVRYAMPKNQYEYFYVKVINIERTTVSTIDSTALGVTLKMLDYNSLGDFTKVLGGTWNEGHITQGLLRSKLVSNYPVNDKTGDSISSDIGFIIANGRSVNNLFLSSVYNSNKTFYYNSAENYAYLGAGSNFIVYKAVGTIYNPNRNNFQDQVGNFLPYNDLSNTNSGVNNTYGQGPNAYPEFIRNCLPNNTDAATDRTLYVPSNPPTDFHFGLYMNAEFAQLKNGKYNDKDMVFNFTGDDDLWVYIDDVLVLDLGGIHIAQSGSINFATGEVQWTDDGKNQSGSKTTGVIGSTTIYNQFRLANADLSGFNGNRFNDYTKHTITMFYLERGEGESDLMMSFNLPVVPSSSVSVAKEVKGLNKAIATGKSYTFQLYVGGELQKRAPYKIQGGGNDFLYTDNTTGNFSLKDGQSAIFDGINAGTTYYVKEVSGENCTVSFNGATVSQADNAYTSATYTKTANADSVVCTNDYSNVTADLKIYKTNNAVTPVPLENAVFALYINTGTVGTTVWTRVGPDYTTDSNGTVTINDLSEGNYKLEESTAPTGYVLLPAPIFFSVSSAGGVPALVGTFPDGVSKSGPVDGVFTIKVKNGLGYMLPETGGAGTNMFTKIGTFLIFLAFAGTILLFLSPQRKKWVGVKAIDRGGGCGFRPDI